MALDTSYDLHSNLMLPYYECGSCENVIFRRDSHEDGCPDRDNNLCDCCGLGPVVGIILNADVRFCQTCEQIYIDIIMAAAKEGN